MKEISNLNLRVSYSLIKTQINMKKHLQVSPVRIWIFNDNGN